MARAAGCSAHPRKQQLGALSPLTHSSRLVTAVSHLTERAVWAGHVAPPARVVTRG